MARWDAPYELRKLTVKWSRTPSVGVVQDQDMCTFHFLNLTGDQPDASWTSGDYTTVESLFDTFWTTLRVHYKAETKLAEYHWRADGPAFRPFGDDLSPTLRVTAKSVAGTEASAATMLPPQCAMSVTEVTSSSFEVSGVGVPGQAPGTGRTQRRNRWGRFYLPAMTSLDTNDGRFDIGACTSISQAVKTFYNGCVAADIIPVMYSPTEGSAWSIDAVHIDDIVDVVRSRRYQVALTRAPNNIDAP